MAYNYEYPYTDTSRYNSDWLIKTVKELATAWLETKGEWRATIEEWEELKEYVEGYFRNLDVSEEVNSVLGGWLTDGTIESLIHPYVDEVIPDMVSDWLGEHITTPEAVVIDTSLSVAGAAADSKATGDAIASLTGIVLDTVELVYNNVGFLDVKGELKSGNTGWETTDYIEIDTSNILLEGEFSQIADIGYNVCLYDSNKDFVSGLNASAGVIDVPINAYYVRICRPVTIVTASTLSFIDNSAIYTKVKDLELSQLELITQLANAPKSTGYVTADGSFNPNNEQWEHTGYLPVKGMVYINLASISRLGTVGYNYAFYDALLNFISGVDEPQNTNIERFLDVPAGASYMVISNTKTNARDTDYIRTAAVSTAMAGFVIVDKENGDFASLTEAVNNCTGGETIFVKAGIYENEHIKAWGKELSIIGESPLNTIIVCDDSSYANPLIEFSTGKLENIQLRKAGEAPNAPINGGYTMHVEDDFQKDKTLYCHNVIFTTFVGSSCLGMGMRVGSQIIFDNCQFISKGQGSVVYIHDGERPDAGEYDLQFHNCYFENIEGPMVTLQSQEIPDTKIIMTWINNTFFGTVVNNGRVSVVNYKGGTSTNDEDFEGLINWRLKGCSRGNSLSDLNA